MIREDVRARVEREVSDLTWLRKFVRSGARRENYVHKPAYGSANQLLLRTKLPAAVMSGMGIESQIALTFVPERWGQVERFINLHFGTYQLSQSEQYALHGAANNFKKALSLARVATTLALKIQEDLAELDQFGASSAERSRQFTAVVEAEVTSLYSSLNCTVKVLRAVFPKAQGLPDSTRKLFNNAAAGKLDSSIPEAIRSALASATWFDELRVLRDALTHSNTGHCHPEKGTDKITYFHDSLRGKFHNGVVHDFVSYLNQLVMYVNQLLGLIYQALNRTLNNEEVQIMCGTFGALLHMRMVRPPEVTGFNSGRCISHTWFDLPEKRRCPLADHCGAYQRR